MPTCGYQHNNTMKTMVMDEFTLTWCKVLRLRRHVTVIEESCSSQCRGNVEQNARSFCSVFSLLWKTGTFVTQMITQHWNSWQHCTLWAWQQ